MVVNGFQRSIPCGYNYTFDGFIIVRCMSFYILMACRDVWNTWPSGLWSPQNLTAKPEAFVATGGPRAMYFTHQDKRRVLWWPEAMYFTHHGKPWLKPIIAGPLYNTMTKIYEIYANKVNNAAIDDSNRRRKKIGFGCSREVPAPLILFFKLLFRRLNIDWHFKTIFTIATH